MNFSNDIDDRKKIEILQNSKISFSEKEDVFCQIVEKYKNKLFNMVYNFIKNKGSAEDAEEIVLDTFVRFYKNVKKFRYECTLESYLRRIAINLAINFVKTKKVEFLPLEEFENSLQSETVEKEIINDVEQEELKKTFDRILSSLPERQRVCFYLAHYENLSYKEIAEVLSTTVPSVESLLFRAKQNIKKYVLKNKEIAKKLGINL